MLSKDLATRIKETKEHGDDIDAHRKLIGHCILVIVTVLVAGLITIVGMHWGFFLMALPQSCQEFYDWIYKL